MPRHKLLVGYINSEDKFKLMKNYLQANKDKPLKELSGVTGYDSRTLKRINDAKSFKGFIAQKKKESIPLSNTDIYRRLDVITADVKEIKTMLKGVK
jgi:hypothetical protein